MGHTPLKLSHINQISFFKDVWVLQPLPLDKILKRSGCSSVNTERGWMHTKPPENKEPVFFTQISNLDPIILKLKQCNLLFKVTENSHVRLKKWVNKWHRKKKTMIMKRLQILDYVKGNITCAWQNKAGDYQNINNTLPFNRISRTDHSNYCQIRYIWSSACGKRGVKNGKQPSHLSLSTIYYKDACFL